MLSMGSVLVFFILLFTEKRGLQSHLLIKGVRRLIDEQNRG
jgi:hypothetical protein